MPLAGHEPSTHRTNRGQWVATCSCRWYGAPRPTQRRAFADTAQHQLDAARAVHDTAQRAYEIVAGAQQRRRFSRR